MCGGQSEDNEVVWEVPPSRALRGRLDWLWGSEHVANGLTASRPANRADPMDLSDDRALRQFLDHPPPSFCAKASLGKKDKFRWSRRFTKDVVTQRVQPLGVGDVISLAIEDRGKSGRLRSLKVVGTHGVTYVHRELPVRRMFNNLPSGLFVIDEERANPSGPVSAFVFRGGGHGHGVGMCQTGAVGMAELGYNYKQILRHYYNGAQVLRVY
jgi:peptidoglycan hydrolase-like amidase